jgi:hypothetical protein
LILRAAFARLSVATRATARTSLASTGTSRQSVEQEGFGLFALGPFLRPAIGFGLGEHVPDVFRDSLPEFHNPHRERVPP